MTEKTEGMTEKTEGRLAGRTAVVVGGGQTAGETIGIGRATAITFAREGARLLVVDINGRSAEETVAMIREEGGTAFAFEADITRDEECKAFAARAEGAFGRIDILHNSVGTMAKDNHAQLLEEQAWDRIQAVNVKGMFLSCRAVLPAMRSQRSGAITNISATAAMWSGDPYVAYNTSMAAVNGLTTSLVVDCAKHGIRINAILPGHIDTPMSIEAVVREKGLEKNALRRARSAAVPLNQRMGSGWDIAKAALFLASDDARMITGALLPIDGGQLLKRG